MSKIVKYSWFIPLAVLVMAGCTQINENIGTPLNFSKTTLSEGSSHYREALKQLGPPAIVSSHANGVIFLYEYAQTRERQLGTSIDYEPIPWLKWFKFSYGRGSADRQVILLMFDDRGILHTKQFQTWSEDLGGGFGVELFFSVRKQVDTSGLYRSIGINQWGVALLRSLAQALYTR